MKEVIIGYRFRVNVNGVWRSSPYPGYKTEEECDEVALQYRRALRKRGYHVHQIVFFDEIRREKIEQA